MLMKFTILVSISTTVYKQLFRTYFSILFFVLVCSFLKRKLLKKLIVCNINVGEIDYQSHDVCKSSLARKYMLRMPQYFRPNETQNRPYLLHYEYSDLLIVTKGYVNKNLQNIFSVLFLGW